MGVKSDDGIGWDFWGVEGFCLVRFDDLCENGFFGFRLMECFIVFVMVRWKGGRVWIGYEGGVMGNINI